jgi:hypothetical protein
MTPADKQKLPVSVQTTIDEMFQQLHCVNEGEQPD